MCTIGTLHYTTLLCFCFSIYYPCVYNYVGQIKRGPGPQLDSIWATRLKTQTHGPWHCIVFLEMCFGLVRKLNWHIYFIQLILPQFEIALHFL
jgi:hypothetical protein